MNIPAVEYNLSNAELVVLLLVASTPGINGYGIRTQIQDRGFDAWAGVASSSMYNSLNKLNEAALIETKDDDSKTGRGPTGQANRVTPTGRRALKAAIKLALATSRESDPRFNLALSGLELVGSRPALNALSERRLFLDSEIQRIEAVRLEQLDQDQAMPISAQLLFDRIVHTIEAESTWVSKAMETIKEVGESDK